MIGQFIAVKTILTHMPKGAVVASINQTYHIGGGGGDDINMNDRNMHDANTDQPIGYNNFTNAS